MQREITAKRWILITALSQYGTHMTALAAVVAGIAILIIGAYCSALGCIIINCLQCTTLKIGRKIHIVINECLGDHTGFVFTEGPLHDTVFVWRIVECGFGVYRTCWVGIPVSTSDRIGRGLGAIIMGKVSHCRIGDVMTGTAEVHGSVELGLHPLVPGFSVRIWPQLFTSAPKRGYTATEIPF
jgi:hypothetical protein